MTSYCSGVSFPVVFFDGEYESNIGNITIHPSMNLQILQSILTQMIGISSHQFTVYRVNPTDDGGRRRNPITAKSNFAAIANDQDCFVLVVLKRSRKQRRRRTHQNYHQIQHDPDEYWNYLMIVSMMARNGGCFSEYDEVVCGECRRAMLEGTSPEFHCCLYDPVVGDMFKTKAGAIARPPVN